MVRGRVCYWFADLCTVNSRIILTYIKGLFIKSFKLILPSSTIKSLREKNTVRKDVKVSDLLDKSYLDGAGIKWF